LLLAIENRVADDGVVLVGAEDDADGGAVVRPAPQVVVEADIHIHLADVLVCEFLCLEVEEHEAFEQVIVEHQVKVEVTRLGADALLASDEGKVFAQFQEKGLEVVE